MNLKANVIKLGYFHTSYIILEETAFDHFQDSMAGCISHMIWVIQAFLSLMEIKGFY